MGFAMEGPVVPVVVDVDVVVPPTVGVVGAPVEAVVAVPGALGAIVPEVLGAGVDDALEEAVPEVLAVVAVPLAPFFALTTVRLVILENFFKAFIKY